MKEECDFCGRQEFFLVPYQGAYVCDICKIQSQHRHDLALLND